MADLNLENFSVLTSFCPQKKAMGQIGIVNVERVTEIMSVTVPWKREGAGSIEL